MASVYEVDDDLHMLFICEICGRLLFGGILQHATEQEAARCAKLLERKRKWLLDF